MYVVDAIASGMRPSHSICQTRAVLASRQGWANAYGLSEIWGPEHREVDVFVLRANLGGRHAVDHEQLLVVDDS